MITKFCRPLKHSFGDPSDSFSNKLPQLAMKIITLTCHDDLVFDLTLMNDIEARSGDAGKDIAIAPEDIQNKS
jgi:hypothetical protein